jgi:hypothetical protein
MLLYPLDKIFCREFSPKNMKLLIVIKEQDNPAGVHLIFSAALFKNQDMSIPTCNLSFHNYWKYKNCILE